MTVPATSRKAGPYTGTGATGPFPFSFKIFAITDVKVVVADLTGAETTLSSGYTVSMNADQVTSPGGSVSITAGLTTGYKVTLLGNLPYDQTLALPGGGNFNPVAIENALDRTAEQIQQLAEASGRALSLPANTAAGGSLPPPVALALIGWNAAGTALQNFAGTASALVSTFMANVVAAADASAALTLLGFSTFFKTLVSAVDAAALRLAVSAAALGANNDITSLNALSSVPAVVAAAITAIPVRQTVLSGPVDTNGLPSFGGSTGSTTVTASGTLIATASNGFSSSGNVDRIGSSTNPSWTGLSTNGTMYLYLDIAANGACTTGSTTLLPTYRFGGADVVTAGQHTFNKQEMQMKVGNGSTASQVWRVFVGEVTVSGGVVAVIAWYALMGRYERTQTMPAANTPLSFSHNLGAKPDIWKMVWVCGTAQAGLAVGDELDILSVQYNTSPNNQASTTLVARMAATYLLSSTAVAIYRADTGGFLTITASQFTVKLVAQRGW